MRVVLAFFAVMLIASCDTQRPPDAYSRCEKSGVEKNTDQWDNCIKAQIGTENIKPLPNFNQKIQGSYSTQQAANTSGKICQAEGFKKGTKLYLDCMQAVMHSQQEYARQQTLAAQEYQRQETQKNQALIDMGTKIMTEGYVGTGYKQPRQMTCKHQGEYTRCDY